MGDPFLDVKMSGMGGLALQELLEGNNPQPPTVFITAQWDEALLDAVRPGVEIPHPHST